MLNGGYSELSSWVLFALRCCGLTGRESNCSTLSAGPNSTTIHPALSGAGFSTSSISLVLREVRFGNILNTHSVVHEPRLAAGRNMLVHTMCSEHMRGYGGCQTHSSALSLYHGIFWHLLLSPGENGL